MSKNYKFDVAFSFLQQDERLALELNSLLKTRVSTFIYSEQQKKLAGKDGEVEFNNVFHHESRIVVVLFREAWGKATWTKIEETAIRNRGFEEGYDFVTFIPLESPVKPPAWLPKNRLWIGLERWGIESAASVIEARIQEFGGEIVADTIINQLEKEEEKLNKSRERERQLSGQKGHDLHITEFRNLIKSFRDQVEEIQAKQPNWNIAIRENQHQGVDVISYGLVLSIHLYTGMPIWTFLTLNSNDVFDGNKNFGFDRLRVDIDQHMQVGWSERDSGKKFKLTNEIRDYWMKKLLELAAKVRSKY